MLEGEELRREKIWTDLILNREPTKNSRKWKEKKERYAECFRYTPTSAIAAELMDNVMRMNAIIDCSKNMKGTCVRNMKEATAKIMAAIVTLRQRANNSEVEERMDEFAKDI